MWLLPPPSEGGLKIYPLFRRVRVFPLVPYRASTTKSYKTHRVVMKNRLTMTSKNSMPLVAAKALIRLYVLVWCIATTGAVMKIWSIEWPPLMAGSVLALLWPLLECAEKKSTDEHVEDDMTR